MLGFLRRKMKIILWVIIVGITVTFVFFGINTRISQPDDRPLTAGELFGKSVSLSEFNDAFLATSFGALINNRNLDREMIMRMAWDRLLTLKEAARLGISVSDRMLADTVRQRFGQGANFSREFYEGFLRRAGITPAIYEKWVREEIMIERLFDTVRQMAWLPDSDIERQLRERGTRFTIRYHLVETEGAAKAPEVTEEEINEFYEIHREKYKKPPAVNARYVLATWPKVTEVPEAEEDEIVDYYESHQDEFAHGDRVKAKHILFAIKDKEKKRDEAKALENAKEVLKKLENGADFGKLARKYSQDEKTRNKSGSLGFIERTDMPPVFSDSAFGLKAGELSEIVRTGDGYHIIAVDEVQEPGTKPLDEVRQQIASILERSRKQEEEDEEKKKVRSKMIRFSTKLAETYPLNDEAVEKAAVAHSLDLVETGPFTEKDALKDIGYQREFNREAFKTDVGDFSNIVELKGKGYAVIIPKEKFEERTKTLEEVRGEITEKLTREKVEQEVHELAARQREEVEKRMSGEGIDFQSACEALSLDTEESTPFSSRGAIPSLGYAPEIAKAASGLKQGELSPVFDIKEGACFFVVTGKEVSSAAQTTQEIESFRPGSMRTESSKLVSEWSRNLRDRAKMVDYLSVTPSKE